MNVLAEVVVSLTGATFVALAGFIVADAVAEYRVAVKNDQSPLQSGVRAAIYRLTPRSSRRETATDLIEHSKAA